MAGKGEPPMTWTGDRRIELDEALLARACTALDVRLLVLFGSRATGMLAPAPESDLDLAVSFIPTKKRRDFWEIHR
jgi:predicted nucleotidyltransferase